MSNITIIGGHGKVALLATPLLVEDGHTVRSFIRNPDHAGEVAALGAEPVVADVETMSEAALAEKFANQDVVVWSAGAGGGSPARTYAVDRDAAIRAISAAEKASVGHYVMVSYFQAGLDHGVPSESSFFPYAEAKAVADMRLQHSSLNWTILKPSKLTLDDEPIGIDAEAETGGQVSRANVAETIRATIAAGPEVAARKAIPFNDGSTPPAEAVAGYPRSS